ncbi:MAG: lactate racemase domain-containing protein [Candidatus Hermodarchaeota archaeon]|nr:lactate racemase domain-containing protein [Candidatus Hermodarchaeota archaeon]
MAKLQLRYGQGQIRLQIPDTNLGEIVQPRKQAATKDVSGAIRKALENPEGITLSETISNRRVCVLIEDGTRAEPHEVIIDELTRLLEPAKDLTFIITTGSHEPNSARNQEIIQAIHQSCRQYDLTKFRIITHDALTSSCKLIGTTSRGTEVRVNAEVLDLDAFVVAADMKNHYFAGYSNVIKNFLPGLCDFAAIEANHSLALEPESTFGRHPFHPDSSRRTNPVAEDMLEATKLIMKDRPGFMLGTVTSGPYILWAGSGAFEPVTANGIRVIDESSSFTVPVTDHIIVTPGGFPQDESLYNAQRGLELTKNAVRDNGEILLLAECPKGIAPTPKAQEFFYDYLIKPLPEMMSAIKTQYRLYTHKSWKFGELIQRLKRIWLFTTLDQGQVETAHLHYTNNPQQLINAWIENDSNALIHVFHDANKIAVYGHS